MKKLYFLILTLLPTIINSQSNDAKGASVNVGVTGNVDGVYINEFHYDNNSGGCW